jgi:MOSC domain-containing protein YiiM
MKAELVSLQVGTPQTIGRADATDPMDQVWTTGFFKEPVAGPVWLGRTNLEGDGQADLQNHGGPDKAVNVYPFEHYAYWEQELGVSDWPRGAFGENFTVKGLLESDVCIGDVFEVGEALVQVSQPRQPCWKLARRWRRRALAFRVQQTGRTGWYFRVLREGYVQAGTGLVLVERLCPEWTVTTANEVMHHRGHDAEIARALAVCPVLSSRWREKLARRATTGVVGSSTARLYGPNG